LEDIYLSIRSYIEYKLKINVGSQIGIEAPSKDEVVSFCNEQGIDTKGLTKEQLIEKINELKISDKVLINHFSKYLGIHSSKFQEKFGVDHKTIKKLEKKGLLPVMHKQRTRAFGKYLYVPMYSAMVYFDTIDNFKKLLEQLE
jgi:hypothetical protein